MPVIGMNDLMCQDLHKYPSEVPPFLHFVRQVLCLNQDSVKPKIRVLIIGMIRELIISSFGFKAVNNVNYCEKKLFI